MPRPLRDRSAGIRHVTCRGNRRQPIFLDDLDRECYLGTLDRVCGALSWRVVAWCLMGNHAHLVLNVPADTISCGMQRLSGAYAQAFNWRHGYTGHLFQGRFRAETVEDESYLFELIPYVDLNPERAGLVERAELWPWSGHRAHLALESPRPFHDVSWRESLGATPVHAAIAYAAHVDAVRARAAAGARQAMSGV